jgi:hypothetical protein
MERTGAPPADAPVAQQTQAAFDPLNFVAPTEIVDLPSKGNGYPEGHPLHGKTTIEIRYMTAKEEDILTSQSLIKKGIVLERFLQSIILDKNINSEDLFVGDRNAILIAARISGYGADYEARVACPACNETGKFTFDLHDQKVHESQTAEDINLVLADGGMFETTMPYSKFKIKFKILTGKDEAYLAKLSQNKRKGNLIENTLTDQMKRLIVSIEGHTDRSIINKYVDNMPTLDSSHLRTCYKLASPDVKVTNEYTCPSCGHQEGMEVPFGADFFWPQR